MDAEPLPSWIRQLTATLTELAPSVVHFLCKPEPQTRGGNVPWIVDRVQRASQAQFDAWDGAAGADGDNPGPAPYSPEKVKSAQPDLILWLARETPPDERLDGVARHGIAAVEFGDGRFAIPFWSETANHRPVTETHVLWCPLTVRRAKVVRTAETATWQGVAFTRNAAEPTAAASRMLGWFCRQLACHPEVPERLREAPERSTNWTQRREYPSNWSGAQFVAGKFMRSAWKRLQARGRKPAWFVAIRPNRGASVLDLPDRSRGGQAFQDIPLLPGSEQMADPFVWEHGGRNYLLFEDIPASTQRGRIGCSELDANGAPGETRIILEYDTHMSYPCVVPSGGELFLVPETADARQVQVLRFRRFPWDLELVSVPVDGDALVDCTPVKIGDLWYIFGTTPEPFMETLLFIAERLDGPWRLHPSSPISGSVTSSRSAGHLFRENGRLLRPTQDCSVRYGYAMTINEVVRLTPTEFEERRIAYIPPGWQGDLLGTHTWNENANFQVIDGLRLMRSDGSQ